MRVSTVLGAIVLTLIITNEVISACRFLTVEGSYMRVSTVPHIMVPIETLLVIRPGCASEILKSHPAW